MNIHWLQHVPFEGLGRLAGEIAHRGHALSCSRLYLQEALPSPSSFDMLIIMGGPMNIFDDAGHPWLAEERRFIRQCVDRHKTVLGICLGAQLLADALGGTVSANAEREIGWYEIHRSDSLPERLAAILPSRLAVLHWHGDTFSLPPEAVPLYSSAACANQAFIAHDRMVGLQFHLEMGHGELQILADHCGDELQPRRWVQNRQELLAGIHHAERTLPVLQKLLDYLLSPA